VPDGPSLVGYTHDWRPSEKTANPESSFYGHKSDKIGEGGLETNQRYVDLLGLEGSGTTWLTRLQEMAAAWQSLLKKMGAKAAYELLVGKQKDFLRHLRMK
jgi:hypothetical protein